MNMSSDYYVPGINFIAGFGRSWVRSAPQTLVDKLATPGKKQEVSEYLDSEFKSKSYVVGQIAGYFTQAAAVAYGACALIEECSKLF